MSEPYVDGDEEAAAQLPSRGADGTWQPECWSKSPVQLQEEARAMNNAAIAASVAMGGRTGGNPPAPPSWARDT